MVTYNFYSFLLAPTVPSDPNPQNLHLTVPFADIFIGSAAGSEVLVTSSTIPIVNPLSGSSKFKFSNKYYDNMIDIVERNMAKVSELTGRKHNLFDYYGAEDAKHVVVAMGSVTEALEETIDYLNAKKCFLENGL